MKLLLIATTLFLAVNAQAACELHLQKKKASAKTAIFPGTDVTISNKVLKALGANCELHYSLMSNEELIQLEQIRFDTKIKKLKGL